MDTVCGDNGTAYTGDNNLASDYYFYLRALTNRYDVSVVIRKVLALPMHTTSRAALPMLTYTLPSPHGIT